MFQPARYLFLSMLIISNAANAQDFLKPKSTLNSRWELEDSLIKGNFTITPYKPVYVTAGRWSSSPNKKPTSENPAYSVPLQINYNEYEVKFQLSLKTKIVRGLIAGKGDLWVAYTQQSHWQLYNAELSRPFRELNYEPEVILNFKTNYSLLGFNGKMLSVAFNHQSNGRAKPLSRSWNRIMLQAGFEKNNWQVYLRPWLRLPDRDDENPAITEYLGRGEAVVAFNAGRHQFSTIVSHAFDPDHFGRANIQANWVFPVFDNLRFQLQLTNGYGESLIDYNYHQTTAGISVAFIDW